MPGGRPTSEIELSTFGSTQPEWGEKKRQSKATFNAPDLSANRQSRTMDALDLATSPRGVPSPAKKASRAMDALDLATPHKIGVPSPAKRPTPSLSPSIMSAQTVKDNIHSARNAFGLNANTLIGMSGAKGKDAEKIAKHWQKAIGTHDKMLDKVLPHMQGLGGGGASHAALGAQSQKIQGAIHGEIGKIMEKKISKAMALPKGNKLTWK